MQLGIDLTVFPPEVMKAMHDIFTREAEVEQVQARIRQEKIAKFYHDNRPAAKDGFGGMELAIDPYWVSYFQWKYGQAEAWGSDFREWLKKREPMFRVRHTGTRPQVLCGWEGNKREVRKYSRGGAEARGGEGMSADGLKDGVLKNPLLRPAIGGPMSGRGSAIRMEASC